ncbi:hypothetical protein PIIN_10506 [Serendipita indica DSM 11827]|uniref:DUF676 domain-containing protein n=1 Tax=Serendipita indica (strain DSM 11827) TaxID=1109443 RepID=G4TYX0_SERID|nr:hypothetical protein PIIN_10506 [Serendipita indica DSM 11827]
MKEFFKWTRKGEEKKKQYSDLHSASLGSTPTTVTTVAGESNSAAASSITDTNSASEPTRVHKRIRGLKTENDLRFLELAIGTDDPIVEYVTQYRCNSWLGWAQRDSVDCRRWLRDFLPANIPKARVLTYGYNAATHSQNFVSTKTIYQYTNDFIPAFTRVCKGAPRKPIIFVAHSVGCIIIKQIFIAMVYRHTQSLNLLCNHRGILDSTHSILFLGTPYSGAKGAALLQMMNRILSVFMGTSDAILQHLKENLPELKNIQKLDVSASEGIYAVVFYEVYETPIMGVQFSNETRSTYKTVLVYLGDRIEEATATVEKMWKLKDSH